MWYIMYIILYIIVGLCMIVWWCDVVCWYDFILCLWECLVDVILSAVVRILFGYVQMVLWWLCPDFIVIDVIYYFLVDYNVWLYIYVFRRILLFLYVVECRFCLVFIGFMLFIVLWSYFLFMQNFTIVHSRMYRRTPLLYIFCISMNIYYIDHI